MTVDSSQVYRLARRAGLIKTGRNPNGLVNLKMAKDKENCRRHAFKIRFYYKFMKRPFLKIYTPLRNWVFDYYYVSKDLAQYAQSNPIKAAFSWAGFFLGVISLWTKPTLEDLEKEIRQFNSEISQTPDFGLNSNSADYLRELNVALGRQEISSMNLVFFNLYYRQKHGNTVLHPAATCEETQMGIIEKIKAAKEIGFLGYNWVTRYHKSDCDIPTKDMWGKELKDSIEENRISEIWRRLQKKPKYESLLVEPREERYPRAIGLQNLETS